MEIYRLAQCSKIYMYSILGTNYIVAKIGNWDSLLDQASVNIS